MLPITAKVTMEQNDAGIKATGKLDTGNYTSDLIRTIWYFGRNVTKHKNALYFTSLLRFTTSWCHGGVERKKQQNSTEAWPRHYSDNLISRSSRFTSGDKVPGIKRHGGGVK